MNKNDKIIAVLGVVILALASVGVYTWQPTITEGKVASVQVLLDVMGEPQDTPTAISVSDTDPFLPLIATPVAVWYDASDRMVTPLFVQNTTSPSRSVMHAIDQIDRPVTLYIDDSLSAPEWSLRIAERYWNHSDAVLLINHSEEGYGLGVLATPLASYLSIPVIVCDSLTVEHRQLFEQLGVTTSIVCGTDLGGYGNVVRLSDVNAITNASRMIVKEKFGSIEYLTITNPVDAWPPELLNRTSYVLGPKQMDTSSSTYLLSAALASFSGGDSLVGTFTIPKDYKYALVKFKGYNLHDEHVDELGDNVIFGCGIVDDDEPSGLQKFEVFAGGTGEGGIPVRDDKGNIIADVTYNEAVLYGRGGEEYQVTAQPFWLASKTGEVKVEIEIEKLSDPVYPMMKGLSSVAPYLTAYHQGIIYGRPSFAFTADDDVLYLGEPSPGFYMPRRNPKITDASNKHLYEVHKEINQLLAQMAEVSVKQDRDLQNLQRYYQHNPLHIALVGGATVLPQFIYENSIQPVSEFDQVPYYFGAGIPSDFIYGNIDPKSDEWSGQVPDQYTTYPYQENIVGRITGWDAQDASALICRNLFYEDIIDDLDEWKDSAAVMLGGGNDFQKPFASYKLFGEILNLISRGEPMKKETGASYFNGLALQQKVEELGFDTSYVRENQAVYQGFSNEAITLLKNANLLNKFLLSPRQIRQEIGEGVAKGGETHEHSNFVLANAHGNQHMYSMGDIGVYKLGMGLPRGILPLFWEKMATITGLGPGISLGGLGYYSTRNVEHMDMGPSFLWIESCICGKIDGMYPQQGASQSFLHAGCAAVVASTTTSNVPGGYIEPKQTKYDFPGQSLYRYMQAKQDARKGIYPDQHFGFLIYSLVCDELKNKETSLGMAFREAKNQYLPKDADWEVWWSPPLLTTGIASLDAEYQKHMADNQPSGLDKRLDNKYMSFYEYALYGDPAFIPYVPMNNQYVFAGN